MARKILIGNQKGGVGKTTIAVNLSSALQYCGYKTLLVDLDLQCNSSSSYGIDRSAPTLLDVFKGNAKMQDVIQSTEMGDIVPCSQDFDEFEFPKDYLVLSKALKAVDKKYEYILFDTHPAIDRMMYNGIAAADGIIIPIEPERYAMEGLATFVQKLSSIQKSEKQLNKPILGVLLNNYAGSRVLSKETMQSLPPMCKKAGIRFIKTPIRSCQDVSNAQAVGKSIYDYAPKSNAAKDYVAVLKGIFQACDDENIKKTVL